MFKLHPLVIALIAAQGMILPVSQTTAATLQPYTPENNDNKAGVFCVCNGSTQTLSGFPQFDPGLSGTQSISLGDLQSAGRIISGNEFIGAPRFNSAFQNHNITIPDPNGSGNNIYQVYNSADLIGDETIDAFTQVNDVVNVGDAQYINARVAQVSKGTINVDIGDENATTTASGNSWTMAAKQSQLFTATGTGNMNWDSNNRITFDAVSATPGQIVTIPDTNMYTLNGAFSVTTLDGSTTDFNVTNVFELQSYNDWLIQQLQSGNLSTSSYNSEFSKAITLTNGSITYQVSASNAKDDVAQPVGNLVVLSADGPGATATVNAGKTLEVSNANGGAVQASNGATAIINGKVSSVGTVGTDSAALELLSGSTGINNGVINGGFFNYENGEGIGFGYPDGSGTDRLSVGNGSNGVNVSDGSHFTNNGVLNYAVVGNFSDQAEVTGSPTAALWLNNASAVNNGNINVGMWESTRGGNTSAVMVDGADASFVNAAGATIYLGRTVQNSTADETSDTELNQSGGTRGIEVTANGSAINYGHIVIGSQTQNAVAMQADGGVQTVLKNEGVIDINGLVDDLQNPNIGMLVINAGSGGQVGNSGTINVNSYNSTGLKVVATAGQTASAYSDGVIYASGRDYPSQNAPTYGVWVSGQDGGSATANLSGPISIDGVGAVAIRADGNATVNLTNEAMPLVSNGQNLLGFLIIGPDARVNLPQNGTSNFEAWYSTLFSLQQGAALDAAGMTFNANGGYSTVISGSGAGTTVNTNGATFNLGDGDTALALGSGAQGTIDATTTFNLKGINAIAAVADGNTSLTNHADITLGSEQTGLIVRNQASLTNTGNITQGGDNSTGILAQYGAKVSNSGDITVNNGGTGLYIDGLAGNDIAEVTNTGTINVNGGSASGPSTGVLAWGSLAYAQQDGTLNLNGENAVGYEAISGGLIRVGSNGTPVFNNINQTAYYAQGLFSTILPDNHVSDVNTSGSTLYRLDDGAVLNLFDPLDVTLSGANTHGIVASGSGTYLLSSDKFTVNGQGATAVRVDGGAQATLFVGSQIILNGDNSIGVQVDNQETSLSNTVTGVTRPTSVDTGADIQGSGAHIIGLDVNNGATLTNDYLVRLTGADNTGIRLRNNSTFNNNGTVDVASGTGMDVSGYGVSVDTGGIINTRDGVAGVRVSDGGYLRLGDANSFITPLINAGGTADGILLDQGATGLEVYNASVTMQGDATGLDNRAEINAITLRNTNISTANGTGIRTATPFGEDATVNLSVIGQGTAYNFSQADGSATSNNLILGSGYNFTVSGAGGTAIRANTTGNVMTSANININTPEGGSAIVTHTASNVINLGNIYSESIAAPVIDLRGGSTLFQNLGNIMTPNPATVVVAGGASSDQIALLGGNVIGDVNTGDGTDTVAVTGGTLDGSLTLGKGVNNQALVQNVSLNNVSHITTGGGAGSTLSLNEIAAQGGSFASDDLSKGVNLGAGWSTINFYHSNWALTDNLKLAHSTINIDSASTLAAGNNVNPVLEGATNDSLVVNNAGTLDLTNGSGAADDTLTINGTLASQGGTLKLNSDLNGGGALSNERSDILRVNGTASGTTLIDVVPTASSTGALADADHNGAISATEGTSLAQVSGNASAGSFALKGGYLAAGPWREDLYSFAPGSSDAGERQVSGSGNQYWDYRLANALVSDGSSSRAAVVPQVPSYVSAPVGLAYYTLSVVDDLHKRLGELRHQQDLPAGDGGEMFLRYTGSNMTYKTSQSFKDFGSNFDLDYSAVQVGGNLLRLDGAQDSLRGGVAYTRGNTRVKPDSVDGYSSTSFDSDSLALYMTWMRDSGFYLDGALTYDWHRGDTDIARQKDVAKIRGKGWSASLESGYPFELGSGVRLEPQAQLMYLHLGLDNFTDKDNLTVNYDDYSQTVGRVGARLDRSWSDEGGRQYTPYLRANYYKGWGGKAKTTVGAEGSDNLDTTFTSGKFGQMWQVGMGGTTAFTKDVSVYAEADYRKEVDSNGAKGWNYNAGVRWTF